MRTRPGTHTRSRSTDRTRSRRRSRGAVLVEFGIVAPLLFVLIFGVIEFGWAYLQYLDVRHAAREGGRLAAVNYGTGTGTAQTNQIIDEICTRIDDPDGVSFTLTLPGGADLGQTANVTVSREFSSLTGFFDFTSLDFESSVEVRLEQDATWSSGTKVCP